VVFVAWLLGHDPSKQIISASYSQDLADKHARDTRRLVTSSFYRSLFPRTMLAPDRTMVNDFATTAQGFRMATSVGGTLTGRGADVIILDDIMKLDEALSDTLRSKANEWYSNSLFSRLNSKDTGLIIVVMQRLHQQDLVGQLIDSGDWVSLSLPAIAVEDEVYEYRRFDCPLTFTRKIGEPLHSEREPLESLARTRQQIGEYNFQSQYQQDPGVREGGTLERDWLKYYDSRPTELANVLQSWDTASKPGELNDFSVCTTWGLWNGGIYLLDVFRQRLEYPALKRAVIELQQKYQPWKILIEDRASGIALIQELKNQGVFQIEAYQPPSDSDKHMRFATQSIYFENGSVLLPRVASDLGGARSFVESMFAGKSA
jgi:predicted phage terminase large subunit-like protein